VSQSTNSNKSEHCTAPTLVVIYCSYAAFVVAKCRVQVSQSTNSEHCTAPILVVIYCSYAVFVFGCSFLGFCLLLEAAGARDGLVDSPVPLDPCRTGQRSVGAAFDIVSCKPRQHCHSLEKFKQSPTQGITEATRQHPFATKLGSQRFYYQ
jgi:hypothetical protein